MKIGNGKYKGPKQIICISKKEEGPKLFSLSLQEEGITCCHMISKITSLFPINRISLEVQTFLIGNTELNFTDANPIHSLPE